MEFLSYSFEGRGPSFTDDIELNMDDPVTSRNPLKGCDASEGMGFIEPEMTRKSVLSAQCLENLVDDAKGDSGKSVPSTSTITLDSPIEFRTRFSNSAIEANDEKLVPRKPKDSWVSVNNSVLSSQEPLVSGKRPRIANLQSQVPVCIVHGCNKDLSSSKEYHKRHKVCDIHSKTSVVIVNGIQQRFCQQCSRFHILAEFDEGKRSCRKRLAGHNERRRKPQLNTHFGSMLFGMDLSTTSLLYSKHLPGGFFGQQCYEPTNHIEYVKLEEEPSQICQLPIAPLKFSHSLPNSLHEMEKQYPSKNGLNSPLSVLELSASSNPGCAFSLLSAQSQSLLSNSPGTSTDHPLIFNEYYHSNLAFNHQNSSKSSCTTTPRNFTPSSFSPSSGEVGERFPEVANTVDLVELSLHLQRVEQQKHTAQVKLVNGVSCHSTAT